MRDQFPALAHAGEIYLDSASTTQKPDVVIDAISRYYRGGAANVGRGSYPWATRITAEIGRIRDRVAEFIGADAAEEVAFTSGSTAALNAVALAWGLPNLRDGDEILYNPRDHASNIYPWHRLADILARFGVTISLVRYGINAHGEADTNDIVEKVSTRTRMITVSHLHHIFGAVSTLAELRGRLDPSVLLCFDCSQSGGHIPVDVRALDADFAVLSAHKMFGATGTGVLYCRRAVHDVLDPFLPGGQSGVTLRQGRLGHSRMPDLLEGGTPNIPGILALGAALDFIDGVGLAEIGTHNRELTARLISGLRSIPGIRLLPGPGSASDDVGYGIVSFLLDGASPNDVGFALDTHGFLVRTGAHCVPSTPAGEESVRVSTHIYNTVMEIDQFLDCLRLIAEETAR